MTNELLPATAQVLPADQRGSRPARWVAATLGVVAIGVAAVVGVVTLVSGRNDPDAGEALFVLPDPAGDWQVGDGAITEPVPDADVPATEERFIADGRLYGVEDDDGFDRLRAAVRYPESPLAGAQWEPVTTPVGDSYRRTDESMTFADEDRALTAAGPQDDGDGGWRVISSPSDLVLAYDLLVNDTTGLVLLAVFAPPAAPETPMTSFAMTARDGSTFTVETAAGSPLFDVATYAERIEPVDINGSAGWIVEDAEAATSRLVTWSPETGRTVSVRSDSPRDVLVDAARQLRAVSAAEWASAFPTPVGD